MLILKKGLFGYILCVQLCRVLKKKRKYEKEKNSNIITRNLITEQIVLYLGAIGLPLFAILTVLCHLLF